jgi:hypothetical protein
LVGSEEIAAEFGEQKPMATVAEEDQDFQQALERPHQAKIELRIKLEVEGAEEGRKELAEMGRNATGRGFALLKGRVIIVHGSDLRRVK